MLDVPSFTRPAVLKALPQPAFVEAVALWLTAHPAEDVAAILRVPARALPALYKTQEWRTAADALRPVVALDESGALTRLIHTALEASAKRLLEGDPHVHADGDITYAPVRAKDAAAIAALFIDRRRELYKQIDGKEDEMTTGDVERLVEMANVLNKKYDVTPKQPPINAHPQLNAIDVEAMKENA